MGLAAITWAAMGAQVPVLSPNDHPNPSQTGLGKSRILKICQLPLNSLTNVKILTGKGPWGGGGEQGRPEFCSGPLPWVRGSICKKKIFRTQVQIHIQRPQYAKKAPPPRPPPNTPTPPKRGTQVGGEGVGGSQPKNSLGIIFRPKMTILQGVRCLIPYLGVCYANDPEGEGGMAPTPPLDLTTLFEVISVHYCPGASVRFDVHTTGHGSRYNLHSGHGACLWRRPFGLEPIYTMNKHLGALCSSVAHN